MPGRLLFLTNVVNNLKILLTVLLLCLQMLVRRFLVQKHGMQFRAAVCLQAVWRRCLAQKSLEERRLKSCATVLLQSVWRSAVARWYVQEVRQQHRAVICLQSVWRSAVARSYVQEVRQQHHAVICLQSAWRSFGARSDVQKMRVRSLAAIALQSAWRSSVARSNVHEVRQQYHAVICLQSAWRSYVTRSQVQEVRAVICLQSAWRSYVARSQVRVMRVQSGAVICLQCAWRSSVVRSYLQEVRQQSHAVVCLQSAWRSFVAQLYVHEMRVRSQAAIGLQSAWRGYLAQTRWSEMKLAVTCLQACARKRTARLQFCSVRAGAVTIQAIWRAQLASKKYTGCVHQIVVSQSYVRRKAACIEAARRRTAIILVQSSLRRVNAMRLCDALRETLRNQTIAASAIQRCWRGFCVFVKFHLVISDAITLQNAFRRALATMVARKRLGAVLDLQRSARCWVARRYLFQLRSERDERLRLEMSSALSIQSLFRGHLVRREFLLLNTCAALIQQKTRGYLSQINYRMDLIDIIISQSVVRQWRARRISVLRRESAVLLQAIARMYIAKREVIALRKMMNQVEYERSAALSIQTAYRGFVATRAVSKALAARRIQKTWRCYTVHVDFMLSILAAISIQTSARRFLCERAYCKRLDAVVSVQSFARRVLRQIRVSRIERNAIILQSFARMSFTRARFRLERTAVLMIQRRVRGYLARLELDVQTFAACEIQRIWRGYDAFVDFAWAMLSVIKIQSIVRMRFAQQRLDTLRTERLATKILRVRSSRIIQRVFRDHVSRVRQDQAARTLQRAVKFFLSKAAFSKLRKSTVQIQSIIRGQLTRRLRPKKIKIQLLRIERANIRAKADPKLRLGNRTRTALDVLQTSSRLAEIMNAICTLEIATRLSDVCCASFAEAKAPDILFSLIRTCNRSLPHVELLHHTLLTMSNVAQYDDLMHSMATVTGVEVFLDLVQMFRDKDGVFCLAVSLLERVVRCSEDFQVRTREKYFVVSPPFTLLTLRFRASLFYGRFSAALGRT
jgi:abnormal spindle-like microcephaly-associated protein